MPRLTQLLLRHKLAVVAAWLVVLVAGGGLARRGRAAGIGNAPAEINGHPGLLTLDSAGRLLGVLALDIADGRVQTVRSIINPDKLRHLGPVGDLTALLGGG